MMAAWLKRAQEFLLRVWVELATGPGRSRTAFQTRSLSFIQTRQDSIHLCDVCGKRSRMRTEITGSHPPVAVDTLTCEEHAPDYMDYL